MKVNTVLSYDFTDEERRLVNAYYRMPGLATPDMLQELMEGYGLPRKGEGWFVIFLEGKHHEKRPA